MNGLFDAGPVVLVLSDERTYGSAVRSISEQLGSAAPICVFALAKPAVAVLRDFKQLGLAEENVHFIDAVGGCKGVKHCSKVVSPESLTDLSIAFSEALADGCKSAFLPAMSVLFTYSEDVDVVKFVAVLSEKTRIRAGRLVILTILSEKVQPALRETFAFMDKVVDWRGKGQPQPI